MEENTQNLIYVMHKDSASHSIRNAVIKKALIKHAPFLSFLPYSVLEEKVRKRGLLSFVRKLSTARRVFGFSIAHRRDARRSKNI